MSRIDYIELQVVDIEKSKEFYGKIFGWTFKDYGPEYSSFKEERLEGGFAKTDKVTTGGTLVVFYSEDLEKISETIAQNGGKITRAIFSFPGGQRFHFEDPNGNELAIWSDKNLS